MVIFIFPGMRSVMWRTSFISLGLGFLSPKCLGTNLFDISGISLYSLFIFVSSALNSFFASSIFFCRISCLSYIGSFSCKITIFLVSFLISDSFFNKDGNFIIVLLIFLVAFGKSCIQILSSFQHLGWRFS